MRATIDRPEESLRRQKRFLTFERAEGEREKGGGLRLKRLKVRRNHSRLSRDKQEKNESEILAYRLFKICCKTSRNVEFVTSNPDARYPSVQRLTKENTKYEELGSNSKPRLSNSSAPSTTCRSGRALKNRRR